MRKIYCLFITTLLYLQAYCQKNYWQQEVNTTIAVELNDSDKSLNGNCTFTYKNNSPDSLSFLWIHVWPNAYKNDRTAFSEQLLKLGRTDFYFSDENEKGYINQLLFTADGRTMTVEDHPLHQDIIKVLLPVSLAPGNTVTVETPFHVKLPHIFSRSGYIDNSFQITQWFPKPAVYDSKGWHEMPYLDQGEFYSEFGSYDVSITLPEKYVVAATGVLTDSRSAEGNKTLRYQQNNVHDFAWFADSSFILKKDTLRLGERILQIENYVLPANEDLWAKSVENTKSAIRTRSEWVGDYPYSKVTIVDNIVSGGSGMEYPTITVLEASNKEDLDKIINHEVGHNWFYGILASNERAHPWMDEGMNCYYDHRYLETKIIPQDAEKEKPILKKKLPNYPDKLILRTLQFYHNDQPINTSSEKFSYLNYNLVAYEKTAQWLLLLEREVGRNTFDKIMKIYYERFQFKHPYPHDFKDIAEEISGKDLTPIFKKLETKGRIFKQDVKIRPTFLFNFRNVDSIKYISFLPAIGYNFYDKLMAGAVVHNYNLPPNKFQFVLAPLFATGTKQLNGLGRLSYTHIPRKNNAKLETALSFSHFTVDNFRDSTGTVNAQPFTKITPTVKYTFPRRNAGSTIKTFLQWKTFLIEETALQFMRDTVLQSDIITYPKQRRYLNQFTASITNYRALYPYNAMLQVEQGEGFVRAGVTGNYFFNFTKDGGINVRLFAGKFFYTGDKTFSAQFATDRYHLNMTGPKGDEDYTYNNYFYGRNEFEGVASQQIMIRDGGFKVRTDLLSNKVGKTDDWLIAINLTSDIPKQINPLAILPFKVPIKLYADIGTYAEAWEKAGATGRFLYDAGLQLSLFQNVVNVYFPLLYSDVYKNYFKSTIPTNRFAKTISFSIDFSKLQANKLFPELGLW